jgi:hypothetical protein
VSDAFLHVDSLVSSAARLADDAASAVLSAEQGVLDAGREAVALVTSVSEEAATAVRDAEAALVRVTHSMEQAVDTAKKALSSAINAVADFANKLADGFFGAVSGIFTFSRAHRHIMALHALSERIESMHDEGFNAHAQSLSPVQTKVMSSGRQLLAIGDIIGAFNVVYNGIKGGIEFIKGELNKAVRREGETNSGHTAWNARATMGYDSAMHLMLISVPVPVCCSSVLG